eukprot:2164709-Pyramimonas_sp.AAC.1
MASSLDRGLTMVDAMPESNRLIISCLIVIYWPRRGVESGRTQKCPFRKAPGFCSGGSTPRCPAPVTPGSSPPGSPSSPRPRSPAGARVYSHDGPIGHGKCGYILTTDQSDAGSA